MGAEHEATRTLTQEGAPAPAGVRDLRNGWISRYRIDTILGSGGMGVVYGAYDSELARPVALKLLRHSGSVGADAARERGTRRLLRESQAMAQIAHPNVVTVHDVGLFEGHVFVAMERIDGRTLTTWLHEQPRSWHEILRVFAAAAEGLAAAHAAGLVHRDFKPENVMLGADGRVRVLDFGLARLVEGDPEASAPGPATPDVLDETITQGMVGTPTYMAPEQFIGAGVDARTDQFAFCVAVYRALYRQHPFSDDSAEAVRDAVLAGLVRPSPRGHRAPRSVEQALRRGLSRDREARFPDMRALVAALVPPPRRGAQVAWALAAGGAVAAVVATLLLLRPERRGEGPLLTARQRLTQRGDVHTPAFSPDGAELAFIAPDGIHLFDRATRSERLLAAGSFKVDALEWFPDGQTLLANVEGHPVRIARDGSTRDLAGGKNIGYHTLVEGGRTLASAFMPGRHISLLDLDGRQLRRCDLDGEYEWILGVGGSPKGDQVLVVVADKQRRRWLYLVGVDCSPPRRIEGFADDAVIMWVVWTPGGDGLYALLQRDSEMQLVRTPLDPKTGRRGAEEVVATHLDEDADLAVGPAGEVALVHTQRQSSIWWFHRQPAERQQLTHDTANHGGVAMSPDGKYVAYLEGNAPRQRLRVLPLGGLRLDLTVDVPAETALQTLAWSPSSEQLAAIGKTAGRNALWRLPFDDRVLRRVEGAEPSLSSGSLAWASDGRILYPRVGNQNFIWRDLATGKEEPLIDDPVTGWMFDPVVSADRTAVAVGYNGPARGLLVASLGTREAKVIHKTTVNRTLTPLTWSEDGAWVYFGEENRNGSGHMGDLQRIRVADRHLEPWWHLPVDGPVAKVSLAADGNSAAALVDTSTTDLVLLEPR